MSSQISRIFSKGKTPRALRCPRCDAGQLWVRRTIDVYGDTDWYEISCDECHTIFSEEHDD